MSMRKFVCARVCSIFRIQCERSRNHQQNGISNSRTLCEPTDSHSVPALIGLQQMCRPVHKLFFLLNSISWIFDVKFISLNAHSECPANSTFWCAELNENGNFTSFFPYEPTSNFYGAHFTHSKVSNARELDTENCLCVSSITLFPFSIRFTCEFNFRTF